MSEALHAVIRDGFILPHDLLPDNTKLMYRSGIPVLEYDYDDPYDFFFSTRKEYDGYVELALANYNGVHDTNYKVVLGRQHCLKRYFINKDDPKNIKPLVHVGFKATQSTELDRGSNAQYFCADLGPYTKEVVSCRILEGVCEHCYIYMARPEYSTSHGEEKDGPLPLKNNMKIVPPPSMYTHLLADGVTLSDKAKFRLRYVLLALAYYNKKRHTDYKIVDCLPSCFSHGGAWGVVHCNFIARRNGSDNLFFAELDHRDAPNWTVRTCRVIRGKTRAGCHACSPHSGKRVIHPTRGFHYGVYPDCCRRPGLRSWC